MKLMIGIMILSFSSIAYAQNDNIPPPNSATEVEVINESLRVIVQDTINPIQLIGPMFRPSQLRSVHGRINALPDKPQSTIVQFDEPVVVKEISFVSNPSCSSTTVIRISINGLIAKVLPVSAELWEPSFGIDFSNYSSEMVNLETVHVASWSTPPQNKRPCVVEYVVLAVTPPKKDAGGA
jgi:hypothetical protein